MPLIAKPPSQRLIDIVGTLGGTWSGNVAMCHCPAHNDRHPSLSLRQGDRDILVTCFAGCAPENVLRAIRLLRPDQHFPRPDIARRSGTGNAERLWEEGIEIGGTLAEIYMRGRHFEPLPRGLRFHPRCPYLPKPLTRHLPALLVPVHEGRKLTAVQRIFLDASGRYTMKVMLGSPGRGAWRGGEPADVLAIAEGFETARAYTQINAIPCWATLGARRFSHLVIPPQVRRLLLAGDNDAEGRRAIVKAAEVYARPELQIEWALPPHGCKDWANLLDRMAKPRARSA